jgi:hypothetical protein
MTYMVWRAEVYVMTTTTMMRRKIWVEELRRRMRRVVGGCLGIID